MPGATQPPAAGTFDRCALTEWATEPAAGAVSS